MKMKEPPLKCETCAHFREGIYYEPVCYELTFMDGKKWATKVTHRQKACGKYQENVNRVKAGA
ncbi:hypothetical protein [Sporomusa paucivorans]|uniref:hypothetical protein n=1 Tax=Sporomusa paucivorans TaxID=2376 RepID=UPI003570CB97